MLHIRVIVHLKSHESKYLLAISKLFDRLITDDIIIEGSGIDDYIYFGK
jgi:hypothetical protein